MSTDKMELIIGDKNYSSWSLRPWLVMMEFGFPFDEINIALRKPDTKTKILEHSPSGWVPTLVHGSTKVWDSLAILEYLAELAPEKNLWPSGKQVRAKARSVSAEMHSGFAALRNEMPMDILSRIDDVNPSEACVSDIERIIALWSECFESTPSTGSFLFGAFTIADAMFAPVATRFKTYGVELTTEASEYCEQIMSMPAMNRWCAEARKELQN